MKQIKQKFVDLGISPQKGRKFEELAYLIAIVYNSTRERIENCLKREGLSLSKFNILLALKFRGGDIGLSQTDITKALIVSDGNITGILDRMEKENLAIRTPHHKDRRVNLVRITLKGSDLVERVWPEYEKILKDVAAKIPAAKQDALLNIFYDWADKIV